MTFPYRLTRSRGRLVGGKVWKSLVSLYHLINLLNISLNKALQSVPSSLSSYIWSWLILVDLGLSWIILDDLGWLWLLGVRCQMSPNIIYVTFGHHFWTSLLNLTFWGQFVGSIFWVTFWGHFVGSFCGVTFWGHFLGSIVRVTF